MNTAQLETDVSHLARFNWLPRINFVDVGWYLFTIAAISYGAASTHAWTVSMARIVGVSQQELYGAAYARGIGPNYVYVTYMGAGVIGILSVAWLVGSAIPQVRGWRLALVVSVGIAAVLTWQFIEYLMRPQVFVCV